MEEELTVRILVVRLKLSVSMLEEQLSVLVVRFGKRNCHSACWW